MAAILDELFDGRDYEKRVRPGVNEGTSEPIKNIFSRPSTFPTTY